MLKIATTDESQQAEILKVVDGQPHITLCLQANTDAQKQTIAEIHNHFQVIKQALEAYFSGQKWTIEDPQEKRFVEAEIDCYLSIYSLMWFGWDEIESAALAKFPDGKEMLSKLTPGEMFNFYLDLECENMLHASLKGGTVSAHESYRLLSGLPDTSNSSGKQAKRDSRTIEYAKQAESRSSGAAEFLDFCEDAVKKRLRGNPTLKSKLAEFRSAKTRRVKFLRRILKTCAVRGESWQDGKKLPA